VCVSLSLSVCLSLVEARTNRGCSLYLRHRRRRKASHVLIPDFTPSSCRTSAASDCKPSRP